MLQNLHSDLADAILEEDLTFDYLDNCIYPSDRTSKLSLAAVLTPTSLQCIRVLIDL